MIVLGFLLGDTPPPEWALFFWCTCFPSLAITLSWALIRWKKQLVVLAFAMTAMAAYMLIQQMHQDLQLRAERLAQLEAELLKAELRASTAKFEQKTALEASLPEMRGNVAFFDYHTWNSVPHYSRLMIRAVWFAALFPFVPIILFYFFATNPNKVKRLPPTLPT